MSKGSISCNIAILPPESITEKAIKLSKMLKKHGTLFVLDKKKYYPHVTLYMTEFPAKNLKFVKKTLQQLTPKTKPFEIKFVRYRQSKDGYTDISFKRNKNILQLHKKVVHRINSLREGLVRPKDLARFRQFSKEKQKNLRLYGYDNVLSEFIPHLTLAKLERADKKELSRLSNFDFSFIVKEIGLFQSAEHGTCKKLIARFQLS